MLGCEALITYDICHSRHPGIVDDVYHGKIFMGDHLSNLRLYPPLASDVFHEASQLVFLVVNRSPAFLSLPPFHLTGYLFTNDSWARNLNLTTFRLILTQK